MFALISWGCAGTKWAALALNSHPEIFCVHCANCYFESMTGVRRLDGVEYLRALEAIGTGHRAVGEVHGISRETLPALRDYYGSRLSVAVLVRDPLPRLRSQVVLTRQLNSGAAWDHEYLRLVVRQAGLDPATISYDELSVVHAADMLNRIVEEQHCGPVFTLESLTVSRERLSVFLDHLTQGQVAPTDRWLDHVLALPRQNRHRANGTDALTPREIQIADRIFSHEARECYRGLGYRVPDTL